MLTNSDLIELLRICTESKVKYLVIGGYAVMRYSEPRYTKDLDLWVRVDSENASAVISALRAFGVPLAGVTAEDFMKTGNFYQMGFPPVRVDILTSIPGVEFDAAWDRRQEVNFDGILIPFISKEDLIASKRASGRPQDLLDVEALNKTS